MRANPDSDDVKFDLADAYFRKGAYPQALEAAQQVSASRASRTTPFLALLGDIHAHLGETARAAEIFRDAIARNPDNDQYYLSLTLVQLARKRCCRRERDAAERSGSNSRLRQNLSGAWELFPCSKATPHKPPSDWSAPWIFCPEWPGSYSTLGVFYYQTGQIAKAREVLNRFKGSNAAGGLDVNRIEEVLSRAPAKSSSRSANPCRWLPGSSCFSWRCRSRTEHSEVADGTQLNADAGARMPKSA